MTTSTQLRRGNTGKGGNKGLFDGHVRSGDELTLDGLTDKAFQKQFTAEFVPAGISTARSFDFDGTEVKMDFDGPYSDGSLYFANLGDDYAEVYIYEDSLANPQASLAATLRENQMEALRTLKKRLPAEQHANVDAAMAGIAARQPVLAADWRPEEAITLAADVAGKFFQTGDGQVVVPQGVESMFVDDRKVHYDTHLHSGYLAELVVGESEPSEDDEAQTARFRGLADKVLTRENVEKVSRYVKDTYGLIFDDSEEWGMPLIVRAVVPTVKAGRPVTLEWANEQVADGFDRFQQDVATGELQDGIAGVLGYERDQDDINSFIPKAA